MNIEGGEKEKKIRTFICIDFPDEVVKEVARVQEELGKIKFTGKLTEIENLHLTLKFLGEIEPEKVEKVREVLIKIQFNELNLGLGKIGVFNSRGNPGLA